MEKDSHEKGQAFQGTQGDVYESLLSEIASAGKNGQFRIPSSPYRFRIQIRI
jgi:type I restriction enzyme M protein